MSEQLRIDMVTSSGGAFTTDIGPVYGLFAQLHYKPAASNALDTGADVTITAKTSGMVLANLSNIGTSAFTRAIRLPGYSPTGTETGSSELIAVNGEVLTVTVAQGGDTKSGTLWLTFV